MRAGWRKGGGGAQILRDDLVGVSSLSSDLERTMWDK